MTTDRAEMVAAFKAVVVPALRAAGFTGGFPHFTRVTGAFSALVTVQFRRQGGGFCVNLSYHHPDRPNGAADTPPARLRVANRREMRRMGADFPDKDWGDHWFLFAERPAADVAAEVAALFQEDAEDWWAAKQALAEGSAGDGGRG